MRHAVTADEVHAHRALEDLRVVLVEAAARQRKAGVVDENVNLWHRGCHSGDIVRVLDVELQIAVAIQISPIVGHRAPGAGDSDLRACVSIRFGDPGADTAGATSHQHVTAFVVKPKVRPVGL